MKREAVPPFSPDFDLITYMEKSQKPSRWETERGCERKGHPYGRDVQFPSHPSGKGSASVIGVCRCGKFPKPNSGQRGD